MSDNELPEQAGTLAWVADIEAATVENSDFRRVLFTGGRLQLTVMSLAPGENIGWEMHEDLDQFLRIEEGSGTLRLGRNSDSIDEEHPLSDDWAIVVPGGTWHDVVNTGDSPLKLYSVYGPPDHPDGTVHRTKADAEADHHDEADHHAPAPADD
jgi:mannose-6-phosphate isomerase-like protein (cupin superfamily)